MPLPCSPAARHPLLHLPPLPFALLPCTVSLSLPKTAAQASASAMPGSLPSCMPPPLQKLNPPVAGCAAGTSQEVPTQAGAGCNPTHDKRIPATPGAGVEKLCKDLKVDPTDRLVLLLAWKVRPDACAGGTRCLAATTAGASPGCNSRPLCWESSILIKHAQGRIILPPVHGTPRTLVRSLAGRRPR